MRKNLVRPLYESVCAIPRVRERADLAAINEPYRRWRAEHPCPQHETRMDLYRSALEGEKLGSSIHYLEFGVYRGESIRWWVDHNRDPASEFTGFDSFEGLPVSWKKVPAGVFSTDGATPDIPDPRCHFVKGYFQDTVPGWLRAREFPHRIVANLDADLYGSTLLVLLQLMPLLKPQDVLIFDEFHSTMHEFRALRDAVAAFPMKFRALGRSCGWSQVAMAVA